MGDGTAGLSGTTLAAIELFAELDFAEREKIVKLCQLHQYHSGQIIFSQDDSTRDVYFIMGGEVRVTTFSRTGKEIMFRDIPAGSMFGEIAAIDEGLRSAHVIALSDCSIASMSSNNFWRILRDYPQISEKILRYMANLVRLLSDRVVELSAMSVKYRIHAELLRLGRNEVRQDGSAIITPAPKHAEIASRVSTHREAVSRELSELGRLGIIEKSGGSLIIRDIGRLHGIINAASGELHN